MLIYIPPKPRTKGSVSKQYLQRTLYAPLIYTHIHLLIYLTIPISARPVKLTAFLNSSTHLRKDPPATEARAQQIYPISLSPLVSRAPSPCTCTNFLPGFRPRMVTLHKQNLVSTGTKIHAPTSPTIMSPSSLLGRDSRQTDRLVIKPDFPSHCLKISQPNTQPISVESR